MEEWETTVAGREFHWEAVWGKKRVQKLRCMTFEWSDGHGVIKSAVVVERPLDNRSMRKVSLIMHDFKQVG